MLVRGPVEYVRAVLLPVSGSSIMQCTFERSLLSVNTGCERFTIVHWVALYAYSLIGSHEPGALPAWLTGLKQKSVYWWHWLSYTDDPCWVQSGRDG